MEALHKVNPDTDIFATVHWQHGVWGFHWQVTSTNLIAVKIGLYSNKKTMLKPVKLEWNVAVIKMTRLQIKKKWLGIKWEDTGNLMSYNSLAKVLHRDVVSELNESFISVLPSVLLHSFTKRKLVLMKNANLRGPSLCHDAIWLFTKHGLWMARQPMLNHLTLRIFKIWSQKEMHFTMWYMKQRALNPN